MVKILLFSSIKEKAGCAELVATIDSSIPLRNLIETVAKDNNIPIDILLSSRIAYSVNMELVSLDFIVKDNDEVALLSPVSGGRSVK